MRPLPARSTLFPYTTLFRSRRPRRERHGRGDVEEAPGPPRPREVEEDRKSTRLNSSHVANSYAVFCLKKKHMKWAFSFRDGFLALSCSAAVTLVAPDRSRAQ